MENHESRITLGERASNLFHVLVASMFGLIILAAAFHAALA